MKTDDENKDFKTNIKRRKSKRTRLAALTTNKLTKSWNSLVVKPARAVLGFFSLFGFGVYL
jgi:hypothetical protein